MGLFFKKKQATPLIVVAPDKFKGTITSREACQIIGRAIKEIMPSARVRLCPMADGGEGTSEVVGRRLNLEKHSEYAADALGIPQPAEYYADAETAALDSSAVIGMWKIPADKRRPLLSSSYSLGELMAKLINDGIKKIYLGIGGTATTDCGAGMLQAFGARFFRVDGSEIGVPVTAAELNDIFSADFSQVDHKRLRAIVTGLSDVDVPLEGLLDFAPQKGVLPDEMAALRRGVLNFRSAVDEALGIPSREYHFQGAGGGIGYALGRVLGCGIRPGAESILGIYNIFGENSQSGDNQEKPVETPEKPELIITGEGCFDSQTTTGKAVWQIYRQARSHNVPVLALVGIDKLQKELEGMETVATSPFLRGQELTRNRALQTLDIAARQLLAAICAKMWG